jgi:hypothetical protein
VEDDDRNPVPLDPLLENLEDEKEDIIEEFSDETLCS